ncbi:MAG TPA: F0F1 ATP synthase subunit beta, partial [Bacteroidales bacterium]|nr:F0F1 ATP synthase subunit beta [Bacteroidales bacterium]
MSKTISGRIAQIIGPVIDVAFEQESDLPNLHDALEITRENGETLILEAQQAIGENTIRAIAMDSTDGLKRGMPVVALGKPISMPTGDEIKGRLFNVIGKPIDGLSEIKSKTSYSIHRDPPKFENLTTQLHMYQITKKKN